MNNVQRLGRRVGVDEKIFEGSDDIQKKNFERSTSGTTKKILGRAEKKKNFFSRRQLSEKFFPLIFFSTKNFPKNQGFLSLKPHILEQKLCVKKVNLI
jgi:hypothetical protein